MVHFWFCLKKIGTRTEKLKLDFLKGIPSPSLPSTITEISKQSQDSYLVFSKQTALLISRHVKQIDSMSPWVCSVTDHKRRQNVVRTVAKRLRHSVEISPLPPKTLFPNLKRSHNAPSPPPPIAMLIPFSFNARSR